MHLQRQPCYRPQRFDDHGAEGNVRHEVTIHHIDVDAIRAAPLGLGYLLAQQGEVSSENRGGQFDRHVVHHCAHDTHAFSKMPTNSSYRRAISATAASRVVFFALTSTSGSQKEVLPTAKPMKPWPPAAVVSHSCTFLSSSPRPRMMQPTLSRPPRRAATTIFSQSSRRSSPSIFHTSGSTLASCSS